MEKKKNELDRKQQAAITVVILVTACVLSKFGIIDLIEKGYSLLSYGFMILYLLPILTIGLYKVLEERANSESGYGNNNIRRERNLRIWNR